MSGDPTSWIRGTKDKFGQQFGVPLTKSEKRMALSFGSKKSREKAHMANRAAYRNPTKLGIVAQPELVDLKPIISVRNRLVGTINVMKERVQRDSRAIGNLRGILATLDAFLAKESK